MEFDPDIQERFAVEISNRFSALSEEAEDDWDTYRDEMNAAAMATLGTVQHSKKDCLWNLGLDRSEALWAKTRLAGNTVEYKRLTVSCKDIVQSSIQEAMPHFCALIDLWPLTFDFLIYF